MSLRKGRTQDQLRSSIDSALLAVEIYNKPRATFRVEAYVSLMVIAWTRLFHAHFHTTIGERYYYKDKGKYVLVDRDRKAWDLTTCIAKYGKLSDPTVANLRFFIGLRNKIEHRHVSKQELDALIFGECQSLLLNYEYQLNALFGPAYVLGEGLVYSLQFSALRTEGQALASKLALSRAVKDIRTYVDTYRSALPDAVFESQEYSLKLLQVPRIANASRNDLAIEFVRWDELEEKDKESFRKLDAIVKSKVVRVEAVNVGKLKPSQVVKAVKERSGTVISPHDHKCLYVTLGVRPKSGSSGDPSKTDPRYCHYDELHKDYVYTDAWVDCIAAVLKAGRLNKVMWRQSFRQGRTYKIAEVVTAKTTARP